jgi:YHS domain-containing protein
MLRLLLGLILLYMVLRAVSRLLRGIAAGLDGPHQIKQPPAMPLVRDPVCGTFVVPANAPSFGTGTQMRFFCSENCRRIYQAKSAG